MNDVTQKIQNEAKGVLLRVALFILYYIFLLFLGIGLFIVALWITLKIPSLLEGLDTIDMRGVIIGILAFLAMWWFCIQIGWYLAKPLFIFPKVSNENRFEITQSDCPELFAMIEDTAKASGNKMPKHVYLSPEVNASVFYNSLSIWSIVFPHRKNLNIGIGLFYGMNKTEIAAILSHEFGHFSQQTMRIGTISYRLMLIISGMIDYAREQEEKKAIARASVDYRWYYHLASWPISFITRITIAFYNSIEKKYRRLSRIMEFEADNVACRITGAKTLISALCKLDILSERYRLFERVLRMLIEDGYYLKKCLSAYVYTCDLISDDESYKVSFMDTLLSPVGDDYSVCPRVTFEDVWNTHPTLIERINNAKKQDTNTTNIKLIDASTLIPEVVLDSVFIEREKYFTTTMDNSIDWDNNKEMVDDDFKKWVKEVFSTHRIPSFLTPFVDKPIVDITLPTDEVLQVDNVSSPFTDENRNMLLRFSQAGKDWQTLGAISQENPPIKFSYLNRDDMDINDVINIHREYLNSFLPKIVELDTDIYKFLWKNTNNKERLKYVYKVMLYSNNKMNEMQNLHHVAEEISSQLEFYNDHGAYVSVNDGYLNQMTADYKRIMASFDFDGFSDFCGEWTNQRGVTVNYQLKEWKDFLSGKRTPLGGVVYLIIEVWDLLEQVLIVTKNEWKERVSCAYKGMEYGYGASDV